jgi:hypothetical protein
MAAKGGDFRQIHAGLVPVFVKKAEFHFLRNFGEKGEVRA